jgi:hypothetical protein
MKHATKDGKDRALAYLALGQDRVLKPAAKAVGNALVWHC